MRTTAPVLTLLALAVISTGIAAQKRTFTETEIKVLKGCMGRATEHQDIEERTDLAKAWWKSHRVFRVVNYTRPHCPGSNVALGPKGDVIVMSRICDGVIDRDAPKGFNRVAKAEARKITRKELIPYLRFVLECYVGVFLEERIVGGLKEGALKIGETKTGWETSVVYKSLSTEWTLSIVVSKADGTLELTHKRVQVRRK